MNAMSKLPEEPQLIARVSIVGTGLSLRLVGDFHPEEFNYQAHTVECVNVIDPPKLKMALTALADAKEAVYVRWGENSLHLTSESGEEIQVKAASFSVTGGPLTEDELRGFIDTVYSWYLSDHKFGAAQAAKVERIRTLLGEQARRISIKATSHASGGPAATLYSQQLAFIERVLREIEN